MRAFPIKAISTGLALCVASVAFGQTYAPPIASQILLKGIDFSKATPIDEGYRKEFTRCDGLELNHEGENTFRGFKLTGVYRCSSDPSRVRALLKLPDGGIYWESKMALDVDGSFAATSGTVWTNASGRPVSVTDQCGTSLKWKAVPDGNDCKHPDAQVDPDRFPFVVMPMGGLPQITGDKAKEIGAEFATNTGLSLRDMGVAILGNRWSPVFIADGGPFMRLGEGSARVFKALADPQEDRCRKWSADGNRCVGPGGSAYPYRDFSQTGRVVYILYPKSGKEDLTADNVIARICAFAKDKLGLTGSPNCR